jgi:hypothetical protein
MNAIIAKSAPFANSMGPFSQIDCDNLTNWTSFARQPPEINAEFRPQEKNTD